MGPRILIADDHAQNRKMIRIVLQKTGYETFEAADGEEALRLARETLPAAVQSARCDPPPTAAETAHAATPDHPGRIFE